MEEELRQAQAEIRRLRLMLDTIKAWVKNAKENPEDGYEKGYEDACWFCSKVLKEYP
jgi:hypothetical protein